METSVRPDMFVMFVVVVCSLFVVRPTDTTLLGEAAPEVKEKVKGDTYNVKLILNINYGGDDGAEDGESSDTKKLHEVVDLGVMYDEGRQVVVKGPAGVCHLQQITEAELEAVLADCDPVEQLHSTAGGGRPAGLADGAARDGQVDLGPDAGQGPRLRLLRG